MNALAIARAIHVLAVVLWIGGVGMVTTVLLPAIRRLRAPADRLPLFHAIERRFAWQARATTLLAGASGFYMAYGFDAWDRFASLGFWWMHAMVVVWLLFTLMLFVIEPLFLDRWLQARAKIAPERTYALVQRLHWFLLTISLIAIFGAVAGSHGLSF
jgi:uncharacterized membrane protein